MSGLIRTLERRRRGDLIKAYKIITGKESLQREKRYFEITPNKATRGHRYKLLVSQKEHKGRNINLSK